MKKIYICTTLLLFLATAAHAEKESTIKIDEPGMETTIEFGSFPEAPADTSFISKAPAVLTAEEKEALALAKEWKGKALKPITTEQGMVSFVYGQSMPTIIVAPFKVADLQMQPGERIKYIVLGDNARWKFEVVDSGGGAKSTSHIAITTLDSGLETTALITTDRRAYHLGLKSDRNKHMAYTGFIYPLETYVTLEGVQDKIENSVKTRVTGGHDLEDLDFNYVIDGDASWKPVQIFNNGEKTYLKMPKMQEMPILLVKTAAGEGLVNYRVKDNTFIVDQIFDEGYLIVGVGWNQEKITITRKEA